MPTSPKSRLSKLTGRVVGNQEPVRKLNPDRIYDECPQCGRVPFWWNPSVKKFEHECSGAKGRCIVCEEEGTVHLWNRATKLWEHSCDEHQDEVREARDMEEAEA